MQTVHAIHVWLDAPAADELDVDAYFSVSEVRDDGDEIRCIGSSESLAKAWQMGCERADEIGVECIEMSDESGRVTDMYTPGGVTIGRAAVHESGAVARELIDDAAEQLDFSEWEC